MALNDIALALTRLVSDMALARCQTGVRRALASSPIPTFLRKVQIRKLAMVLQCCHIVSVRCLYFSFFSEGETAKIEILPVIDDCSSPHISSMGSMATDALESTFTIAVYAAVSCVLRGCAYAKVCVLIIQRISIDMISYALVSYWKAKNHAMHTGSQAYPFSICGGKIDLRVERLLAWAPAGVPSKFIKFFKSVRAYFGNLALCQGDFAVFFFWGLHCALLESVGWIGRYQRPDPLIISLEAAA